MTLNHFRTQSDHPDQDGEIACRRGLKIHVTDKPEAIGGLENSALYQRYSCILQCRVGGATSAQSFTGFLLGEARQRKRDGATMLGTMCAPSKGAAPEERALNMIHK